MKQIGAVNQFPAESISHDSLHQPFTYFVLQLEKHLVEDYLLRRRLVGEQRKFGLWATLLVGCYTRQISQMDNDGVEGSLNLLQVFDSNLPKKSLLGIWPHSEGD